MFFRKPKPKLKIGIAFGGGGTLGFAHIGVLRAFEEQNIHIDFVSGTSAGSLIATLVAFGKSSYEIEEFAKTITENEIRNSKIILIPSKSVNIENKLKSIIGDIDIKDMKIPLCIVATQLETGNEMKFFDGNCAKICSASCAVPLIFSPVQIDEYRYIDGGLLNNIPTDALRFMGADIAIGVDVNSQRGQGTNKNNPVDILMATMRIAMKNSAYIGNYNADYMINPDLSNFQSTKLLGGDEMIKIGYETAKNVILEIKKASKI